MGETERGPSRMDGWRRAIWGGGAREAGGLRRGARLGITWKSAERLEPTFRAERTVGSDDMLRQEHGSRRCFGGGGGGKRWAPRFSTMLGRRVWGARRLVLPRQLDLETLCSRMPA